MFLQGEMTVSEAGGAACSVGTDWCNSRWTYRVVSFDLVYVANP
jgi:hypothetical protein